jgi:hypothetical protein
MLENRAMPFAVRRILRRTVYDNRIEIDMPDGAKADVLAPAALRIFRVRRSRFACFT